MISCSHWGLFDDSVVSVCDAYRRTLLVVETLKDCPYVWPAVVSRLHQLISEEELRVSANS